MRSVFLIVLLLGSSRLFAQNGLWFEEKEHHFGEIAEEEGPVDYTFKFENNGLDSLRISAVKASCGCTTPDWSKEKVAPGASGFITARYNPKNRPGSFRKSLKVSVEGEGEVETLYIIGNVEPRPLTIEDELPVKMGALRVKYRSFNFGKINTKEPVSKTFDVYNDGDSVVTFLPKKTRSSSFVEVSFSPESLEPQASGTIEVVYDARKAKTFGYQSSDLSILTSDSEEPKRFDVLATITEYFEPLSPEEAAKAPKLTIEKRSHNFGEIYQNSVVETEFTLTNTGLSVLNVRGTQSNCGCVVAELEKKSIKPGGSVVMKVTFDPAQRKGRQYKSVTIFSNDRSAPSKTVSIRAQIAK